MGMEGKRHTKETRQKMSESHKGHLTSVETRKKLSETFKRLGIRPPYSFNNIPRIKERGKDHKPRHWTPKPWQREEKNYFWKGGISFEPYTINWTETLKRSIRQRDKYICQVCGKELVIIIHHIDYNKKNCNPENLITLCRKCHSLTNNNRKYWINFFRKED